MPNTDRDLQSETLNARFSLNIISDYAPDSALGAERYAKRPAA